MCRWIQPRRMRPGLCVLGALAGSSSAVDSSPEFVLTNAHCLVSWETVMSPKSETVQKNGIRRTLGRRFLPRIGAAVRRAMAPAPPADFDWRWYVSAYSDLASSGITDEKAAVQHWREHGLREGRSPRPSSAEADAGAELGPPPGFDWRWYVTAYTDLAAAGIRDE